MAGGKSGNSKVVALLCSGVPGVSHVAMVLFGLAHPLSIMLPQRYGGLDRHRLSRLGPCRIMSDHHSDTSCRLLAIRVVMRCDSSRINDREVVLHVIGKCSGTPGTYPRGWRTAWDGFRGTAVARGVRTACCGLIIRAGRWDLEASVRRRCSRCRSVDRAGEAVDDSTFVRGRSPTCEESARRNEIAFGAPERVHAFEDFLHVLGEPVCVPQLCVIWDGHTCMCWQLICVVKGSVTSTRCFCDVYDARIEIVCHGLLPKLYVVEGYPHVFEGHEIRLHVYLAPLGII